MKKTTKRQTKPKGFYKELNFCGTIERDDDRIYRYVSKEIDIEPEHALDLSVDRKLEFSNKYFHSNQKNFDPSKFSRKYKKQLRLKDVCELLQDKEYHLYYKIPRKLINVVTNLIQTVYQKEYTSEDKRQYRKYETKLLQALYFCIAIMKFNIYKQNELKALDNQYTKKGEILPKEVLNKVNFNYDVNFRK